MYIVIAKWSNSDQRPTFKTFNKTLAEGFYDNATRHMAGITKQYNLTEIRLVKVQPKSNAQLAPIQGENLFHQSGKEVIDGMTILETIKKHTF